VLGYHFTSRHKKSETLPVSHPLLAPSNCNPFCENCLKIPQFSLLPPSEPISLPKMKVERISHTEVHLELGEEDPRSVLLRTFRCLVSLYSTSLASNNILTFQYFLPPSKQLDMLHLHYERNVYSSHPESDILTHSHTSPLFDIPVLLSLI
jgi:hypothetical protein